ncbi:MAG TPA: Fe-S cluster assembly protein SufD [Acidimicrobiales bacterium]|jgi:Fe-S cluster assembly protein SufD|nr:Fe-S cluster assembly protein SufD [Acidimicrobiales bacterium]
MTKPAPAATTGSADPAPDAPAGTLAAAGWRQQARAEVRAWLGVNSMPTRHDEAWKYTPLKRLEEHDAEQQADPVAAPDRGVIDELAGSHGSVRLVFVNGRFSAAASDVAAEPSSGVVVGALSTLAADGSPAARSVEQQVAARRSSRFDGYQALNTLYSPDAAVVWLAEGATLEGPVHIVHLSLPGSAPSASHPLTFVCAAPRSTLQVVETYAGLPGFGLVNARTSLAVSSGANVTYERVQSEAADTVHVGHTGAVLARDANLRTSSLQLGGDLARAALDVVLAGEGAHADLSGLYLPDGVQHLDNVVTVDHAASRTTSRQLYKGVIDDAGHGCFTGHVIVQAGTAAVDAAQTNRSLLLSRTAQTDTRPWLEILADDVRCSHGATVGRLDEESLFYLRARGIPEATARAVLVGAFAGEVLDTIAVESLRNQLAHEIAAAGHIPLEVHGEVDREVGE